ncbi:MAG: hypothetical protein JSV86_16890 [Gemmatimonadota bacterium]|nr:MAG: hypothetical protein JSV86_16890 [Gemmatimonadota bacterium]
MARGKTEHLRYPGAREAFRKDREARARGERYIVPIDLAALHPETEIDAYDAWRIWQAVENAGKKR